MVSFRSVSIGVVRAALVLGVLLLGYAPAYPDGGGGYECSDSKPPTAAEANILLSNLKSLREAMPAAPAGWRESPATDSSGNLPERIYSRKGCPADLIFRIEYENAGNVMANYKNMDFDKMNQLAAAMEEAAAKGDTRKMQELATQMKAGQPPQNMTAAIEVRCNLANTRESHENGARFSIPPAKSGFLIDRDGSKKVVLYIGRWHFDEGGSVTPVIDEGAPNTKIQFIEVVIDGEIAQQLARQMDLQRMAALTE